MTSPYQQRLLLVADIIATLHPELSGQATIELAEQILHVLNSIPEKLR